MKNLIENPLREITIKQTCFIEKLDDSTGAVQYVTTEIKLFGELYLSATYDIEYYNTSPLKKALDLLLGNEQS
jgi:hypothetical protein|nr:MAG TPA: hypothetical protein [Caudoviricetes sp.]